MSGWDLLVLISAAIVPAAFTLPFRAKDAKNFKWRWLAGMLLGWAVFSPVTILILKHQEDIRYAEVVERSKRGEHVEEWEWYDSPGGYFAAMATGWVYTGGLGLMLGGVRYAIDVANDRRRTMAVTQGDIAL